MLLARLLAELSSLCSDILMSYNLMTANPEAYATVGYTFTDLWNYVEHNVAMCMTCNLSDPLSTILFNTWNWPVM